MRSYKSPQRIIEECLHIETQERESGIAVDNGEGGEADGCRILCEANIGPSHGRCINGHQTAEAIT